MIIDEEIREIFNGKIENKNIDLKRGFTWKKKSLDTLEVIKDILGMVNTQDGGKLIIGFDEKTMDFLGDGSDWFESFEQTKVMDSVNRYSSYPIILQVILKPNFEWNQKNGNLVVLDISEFEIDPVISKEGMTSEQYTVFRAGDIFIRTNRASTERINDAGSMHDLIHRCALKHKDAIIKDRQMMLEVIPIQNTPENIRESYLDETSDFAVTFHKPIYIPTIQNGIWQLKIMPVKKNPDLIQFKDLLDLATTSQSRHRGWPFPIISGEITKPKNTYLETFVPLDSRVKNNEAWRLYRDGLFCWIKSMFENENPDYHNTLSKVSAIWTITEMFLFASRLYEKVLPTNEDVCIELILTGSYGRRYHDEIMSEYGDPIDTGGKCNTEIITIERTISVFNLHLNWKDEVINVIEELDTHFGVRTHDKDYTVRMMNKLLGMHMI